MADAEEAISSKGEVGRRRLLIPLFCRSERPSFPSLVDAGFPPQKGEKTNPLSPPLVTSFLKKDRF